MHYLCATKDMPLTLEADSISMIKWWINGSFGVLEDMHSHTGGIMSLGKGAIYGKSSKQKLNIRRSTKAELVGVDDCTPQLMWTKYFLQSQGYNVTENAIYQDNQSTMLLTKNS